ncbi:uncharacterized protein LOC135682559 isoform X2 [Rhopilema esculentum]|uniref:uncharacterized protein LOC135682559 isoform X2 n=1 Tax=Rhopilema esculentum TaxID=499914 RepID=UPI0031D8C948
MENVERARKKRRTTRGLVTKLLTKIEESLEQDRIEIDCRKLKQFQADLKEKAECLKEIDGTILDGLIDVDADDDTCENEAAEANEIQEKIRFNLICLEEALESIGMKRSTSQESVAESLKSNSSISESHRSFTTAVRVKLPKLELRKFNGKLQEWNEFWDSFNSAVHTDPGLAKVDKFKYLRSFLEEPVRRVISGLALTDDNYDSAVEILSNRYAKPMQIKRAHINDIMNLPPVFNERNIVRLRHLYDDIETHFRGLEALGADKDSYSSVVVPVVMEKIPEAIRINMIRFGGDYLNWNLDELLKALAKELEIREIHTPMLRMNYQPQTAQNQQRPSSGRQSEKTATTSALFAGKERDQKNICQFCLGNHLPEDCSKFTTVAERKNILFKFARCFLCLNKGHRSFDCRSKQTCRYCNGKHNHLICKVKPNSLASDNKVKMQSSDASAAALNPNATTWVGSTESSTSAPDERVALQTALARVKGRRESRMRVLFDTGSQKTFISAKAVDRLALKPLREESLGIKTFGKSEPEVKMREVYELELEPLHNGKSVTVEAFLVDEISTISNVHVEEIKKNYQHLCDIYFSDVSRSEDLLEIDILIGANYLWSFHEGQVIRGGQQDPVAIKTVLGYVLSGPVKDHQHSNDELSKRFLYLKKKLTHFWNRWRKEYLVNLRESHKMNTGAPNAIKIGEVVLVHEDGAKRLSWKKGIIEDLIVGKDGKVRGVSVRIVGREGKTQILNRPVQKVYPLEISITDIDCVENGKEKEHQSGMERKGIESKVSEEKISEERLIRRPMRAAAKDARCKTKLLLDH